MKVWRFPVKADLIQFTFFTEHTVLETDEAVMPALILIGQSTAIVSLMQIIFTIKHS